MYSFNWVYDTIVGHLKCPHCVISYFHASQSYMQIHSYWYSLIVILGFKSWEDKKSPLWLHILPKALFVFPIRTPVCVVECWHLLDTCAVLKPRTRLQLDVKNGCPYLNAFDAEAQRGCGAKRLSPLHVSGFEDSLLGPLLLSGGPGVHCYHLLIHVLPQSWPFSGFGQLFLQVCPEKKSFVLSPLWPHYYLIASSYSSVLQPGLVGEKKSFASQSSFSRLSVPPSGTRYALISWLLSNRFWRMFPTSFHRLPPVLSRTCCPSCSP